MPAVVVVGGLCLAPGGGGRASRLVLVGHPLLALALAALMVDAPSSFLLPGHPCVCV